MKKILVVGSSNGIGKGTAEYFLNKEDHVLGIDLEASTIKHPLYRHFHCDLSKREDVAELGDRLTDQDITDVVYCAAEQRIFSSVEPDLELLHRMLTVNVASAWQLIARLQKAHTASNSYLNSVVLVSSVHAIATSGSIAGYAMTKAALSSLVRSLAIDLAPQKTRVNGVIPGAVRTRLLTEHLSEDDLLRLANRQLVDHIAEPKEIAGAISFLTSGEASYITGQNFIVDGGVLALLATEAD